MATPKPQGGDLFIVDNSDSDWKVLRYLRDWTELAHSFDIATGNFEIGSLLALDGQWQKLDKIRILMGGEVSKRTKAALLEGIKAALDASFEQEKDANPFLTGAPAIVEALRTGKMQCRVYTKDKFHAKAYITHAKLEVVGSAALVGSSNFTVPGLKDNVELNIQIRREVGLLQEWYERYWQQAEDVTPEVLKVAERHTREYMPFEVYAQSLHELFRRLEPTDREWFERESRMYRLLAKYQKDGFHELMDIAHRHRGAFLCDSVGLGKTFIGLMVIEYLIRKQREKVVLLVPKATRDPVWKSLIKRHLPKLLFSDSNLLILNHTDLNRKKTQDVDYPALWQHVKEDYHAVVIDEAHHFRNPGVAGEVSGRVSRYRTLYDILAGKNVFLLTATPINNSLLDLQHMIELFSRKDQPAYFKDLGIHSLPGHFRKLETALKQLVPAKGDEPTEINQAEAQRVLQNDNLFHATVVQRSRAYVTDSLRQEGVQQALFPIREDPQVAPYSVQKTYGRLLDMIDRAFKKQKPLFSLAMYHPLAYHKDPASVDKFAALSQNQVVGLIRTQFLKRFESSARAFEMSCDRLLRKLLAFATKHSQSDAEKRRLEKWLAIHSELIGYVKQRQLELWGDADEDDQDEDLITPEMLAYFEDLPGEQYKINEMLDDTFSDLDQVIEFLHELRRFKPKHDDKLRALLKLLARNPVLSKHKVLIFTEYMDTARYLKQQLAEEGVEAVDEVDSAVDRDRGEIIRQFAPYYNDSSSAGLKQEGLPETRILISTDVLSEGLNLQDATRLINYDLHWNPVRLMQRIGRVDRRMNPDIEAQIVADHPDQRKVRGTVAFWNFLPPNDLERLLELYSRVTGKVLTISKTFGIEGGKLLTPEDKFEVLKNFTRQYEGETTPLEAMQLEYEELLKQHPDLPGRLAALPGRVFSGKAHPSAGARGVFFCYAMPAPAKPIQDIRTGEQSLWTEEAGDTKWYLYDLTKETAKDDERIADDPTRIVAFIRCQPDTPRQQDIPKPTLSEVRAKVERYIKNTYLKAAQAPAGVKPVLKCWMELS